MNKYYVYFHINPLTKEIFYVGKGCGNRAYMKYPRSKYWQHYVTKHGYEITIVESGLTHEDACKLEINWIKKLGRKDLKTGNLINMTDGGDGNNNFSEEVRRKISIKNKGKRGPNKGRSPSKEVRQKISDTLKRKYNSGELVANTSGLNTEQSIKKLSITKKGKPTWNKGLSNIYSDEVRNNIRTSLVKYYETVSPLAYRKEKKKIRNRGYRHRNSEAKKLLPKQPRKTRILTQEHKDRIGAARRLRYLDRIASIII